MDKSASLHPIQIQILLLLMKTDAEQRYSQLQLPGVENDLFNYHLQQLVKTGYVQKESSQYSLTTSGMQYISQLDVTGVARQYFKISVALTVFRNNRKEMLMQERYRQPFIGDITTIAGKVLKGEKVIDTAKRKLNEEAGLAADFTLVGSLRKIRRDNQNNVLEDSLYYCCVADDPSGELIEKNEHGHNFWATIPEALEFETKSIDSGELDLQIIKDILAGKKEFFYYEQDRIVERY